EGERRKGERRKQPRPGADRRRGERRRAVVRNVVLVTAAIVLPHKVKPQSVDSKWAPPPPPLVASQLETAASVPPEHAYDELIRKAWKEYGGDAVLIRSVMQTESAFDAMAVSPAGALGLMQLMPEVAEEMGVEDPFDPRQNIMGGAKYLRRLLDLHRGRVR